MLAMADSALSSAPARRMARLFPTIIRHPRRS